MHLPGGEGQDGGGEGIVTPRAMDADADVDDVDGLR